MTKGVDYSASKSARTLEEILGNGPINRHAIEDGLGPEHVVSMLDMPAGMLVSQEGLDRMVTNPHIVMVSAAFAGVQDTASENAHTKHFLAHTERLANEQGVVLTPEADMNMRALAAIYRADGHHVTVLPPMSVGLDQHYSTDSNKNFQGAQPAGKFVDGVELWELKTPTGFSPVFTHEARQPEAVHKRRYLETTNRNIDEKARRTLIQMENPMEFGDTRIAWLKKPGEDKVFVLAGVAETTELPIEGTDQVETVIGRSTVEGHAEFERYLQEYVSDKAEVITVELCQPFYHMDTTGVITQDGHFFTNRAAYTEKSWNDLQSLFGDKLIEIALEDVDKNFGGNGTSFGNRIYISDKISMETAEVMASKGFDVKLTPIPWTIASGGGHRCMTSVDHICPEGGLQVKIDNTRQGSISRVQIDYVSQDVKEERYDRESQSWKSGRDLTLFAQDYKDLYAQEMAGSARSR